MSKNEDATKNQENMRDVANETLSTLQDCLARICRVTGGAQEESEAIDPEGSMHILANTLTDCRILSYRLQEEIVTVHGMI